MPPGVSLEKAGQTTKQDDWGNQFVRQRNLCDGIPSEASVEMRETQRTKKDPRRSNCRGPSQLTDGA